MWGVQTIITMAPRKQTKDKEKEAETKEKKKQPKTKEKEKEKEPKEPKIKWKKSKARALLYQDIRDGSVPIDNPRAGGGMALKEVYALRIEFQEYNYSKFSARLASLRKVIADADNRAEADQAAFENFKANHPVSLFSYKGYIQWQGSEAQESLLEDMEAGLHQSMGKKALWEHRNEYYENFPLNAFRDFVYQEVRTSKYLHTLKVKGKTHKAS